MRIDGRKVELFLADKCMNKHDLRNMVPSNTLARAMRGEDVTTKTAGKIAAALGVPVADIIEEVK